MRFPLAFPPEPLRFCLRFLCFPCGFALRNALSPCAFPLRFLCFACVFPLCFRLTACALSCGFPVFLALSPCVSASPLALSPCVSASPLALCLEKSQISRPEPRFPRRRVSYPPAGRKSLKTPANALYAPAGVRLCLYTCGRAPAGVRFWGSNHPKIGGG